MKLFCLPVFGLLFGCSPAQNIIVEITEYAGVIPNKESAIAAVKDSTIKNNQMLPCGKHSFDAVEVRTTTESRETNNENESKKINTVFVDEWGVDESVTHPETKMKVNRYWSVNGRTGVIELVGSSGWNESLELCSVSGNNA